MKREDFIDASINGKFANKYYEVLVTDGVIVSSTEHTPDPEESRRNMSYVGKLLKDYQNGRFGVYQVMMDGEICGPNMTVYRVMS